MGCQKAAEQIPSTNRKAVNCIKIRNAARSFFRNYRIVDKIGGTQIKPCPEYTRECLDNQ